MWNIRDGRRPRQLSHFTFKPLPTTLQALYFFSTNRICILRITRGLWILCVLKMMVRSMNLIVDTPLTRMRLVAPCMFHNSMICDVNLFTNRNADTVLLKHSTWSTEANITVWETVKTCTL